MSRCAKRIMSKLQAAVTAISKSYKAQIQVYPCRRTLQTVKITPEVEHLKKEGGHAADSSYAIG
jgi:hypothetical protein